MIEGVDYSDARPGGAVLAAAGKRFAGRYLSPYQKGLTQPELDDLTGHGVDVFLIYEGAAGGVRGGHSQGVADGHAAQSLLDNLTGIDHGLPIYTAVDWDATAADFPVIDAYLSGFASVVGHARTGVYGSYTVIRHVQAAKTAAWFFQTYAWSNGAVAAGIHLYQYLDDTTVASAAVDLTRALQDDFGGTTVALSPADIQSIAEAVWQQAIRDGGGGAVHQAQTYLVWGWRSAAAAETATQNPAPAATGTAAADVIAALQDPTVQAAFAAAIAKHLPTKITGTLTA